MDRLVNVHCQEGLSAAMAAVSVCVMGYFFRVIVIYVFVAMEFYRLFLFQTVFVIVASKTAGDFIA